VAVVEESVADADLLCIDRGLGVVVEVGEILDRREMSELGAMLEFGG
jgi:hypothetical protein